MAFDVYPVGAPIEVPNGLESDTIAFQGRIGPDPSAGDTPTVYLRLVTLGDGAGLAETTDVSLSANSGAFAKVDTFPSTTDLLDVSGLRQLANADRRIVNGLSFIRIRPASGDLSEVSTWRLRLKNNHSKPCRFTFVVAQSDGETEQPWMDTTAVPEFDTVTNQPPVFGEFVISNNGTGQLRIDDAAGTDMGAGFTLASIAPSLAPNTSAASKVKFVAPAVQGSTRVMFVLRSNDTAERGAGGHNGRLRLSAVVRQPLWSPGDILVVDPKASDGVGVGALIRIDAKTGVHNVITAGQLFRNPSGVAIDRDGHAVVSDSGAFESGKGGAIRVDRVSGAQSRISSAGSFEDPAGLVVLPDNTIVVVDPRGLGGAGGLIKLDAQGVQSAFSSGADFMVPTGVTLDANGNLLVLDAGRGDTKPRIIKVSPDGVEQVLPNGTLTQPPTGIAVAADGGILVTVGSPAGVVRIDPNGGPQQQLVSGSPLSAPSRVAVDTDKRMLVTDVSVRGVVRIANGMQSKLSVDGALRTPIGIAVVPKPTL